MNWLSNKLACKSFIWAFWAAISISPDCGYGQIFFQLERSGTTNVQRYAAGDRIVFKTKDYPDAWQKNKIFRILPEDNALVFDDRITYLQDITYFKYYRPWPNGIGTNLMRFGGAWFLFAGIIEGGRELGVLDTRYTFGTDTAVIGGTALLSGFLIKKLWGVSVKKINSKNRVRIIDLRL